MDGIRYVTLVLWLVQLCVHLCSSDDTPRVNSQCLPATPSQCYTLYGWDNKNREAQAINWDQAGEKCRSMGQSLAIITDPETQVVIQELVKVVSSDLGETWVAGRRRHRLTTFSYLDGKAFTGTVQSYYQNNCVKRYLDKHGLREYREIRCTDDLNVHALCQHPTAQSECGGLYENGLCYTLSSGTMNWFAGMSYCYEETQGRGTLAYTDIASEAVTSWLDTTRDESYSLEALVGVRRQPWVWVQGGEDFPVRFFHWTPNAGYYGGDRCITVSPRERGTWKDVPCAELWYYYICQNGTEYTTTTTTTTSTTQQPVVTSRAPSGGGGGVTPSAIVPGLTTPPRGSGTTRPGAAIGGTTAPPGGSKLSTNHIIAIVVGILAVIGIVVVVYAIQRCRCNKGGQDMEKAPQEEYHPAPETSTTVIRQNGSAKQNGGINGGVHYVHCVDNNHEASPGNHVTSEDNHVTSEDSHVAIPGNHEPHSNGNALPSSDVITDNSAVVVEPAEDTVDYRGNLNEDLDDNFISVAL